MSQGKYLSDNVIILNEKDNVATALIDIPAGNYIFDCGDNQQAITLPEDIRAGFKLALYDIGQGEQIYKYGYVIGVATTDIKRGHCVHIHNLLSSV